MAQNITELGFNVTEFNSEKKIILAGLMDILDKMRQISSTSIAPGSGAGWSELTAKIQSQEKAINELQAANVKFAQSQQAVTGSTTAKAQAMQQETKSLNENVEARRKLENSNASLKKDAQEDLALLKVGTISRAEYNKRLTESQVAIERNKNSIKDISKEIKVQTQTEIQAAIAYVKSSKSEQKAVDDLANEYKQLSLAYNEASAKAKNLRLVSPGSVAAKEAAIEANKLQTILKETDASVGVFNRNVGNYAAQSKNIFTSVYGSIRTLANILPGVGIGTIFAVALDPLIDYVKELTKATDAEKRLADTANILNGVRKDANQTIGKELTDLRLIYDATQNVSLSTNERIKAAKYLQETYPETFKNFTTEQILLGEAKSSYDELTKSVIRNATAKAALNKIEQLESEKLDLEIKKQTRYNDEIRKQPKFSGTSPLSDFETFSKMNPNILIETGMRNYATAGERAKAASKKLRGIYETISDETDAEKKIIDDQIAQIMKFVDPSAIIDAVSDDKTGNKIKQQSARQLQALKEFNSRAYEINRLAQERLIKGYEKDYQDQNSIYERKLESLGKYVTASQALINGDEAQQELTAKKKAADDIARLEEEKAGKSAAQVVRINENIKTVQRQLEQDLLLIQAQAADKSIALTLSAADKRVELLNAENKRAIEVMQSGGDAELKKDKDKWDKFTEQLKKSLKDQEDAKKLAAEKDKFRIDKSFQLAQLGEDLITTLLERSLQKRRDLLTQEANAIEDNKNREIEANNSSTVSAQEKAAQLALINANAAAQKAKLDKEAKELDRKQAEYEKAKTIASITLNTAKAIVEDLDKPFKIPFDIAIGAAQLAIALATPIPSYAEGTENHKGGLARYGEDGPELVIEPGRSPRLVERETISLLAKGTRVKPLTVDMVNETMSAAMLHRTAVLLSGNTAPASHDNSEVVDSIERSAHMTVQALRRQKGASVTVNVYGDFGKYIDKSVRN